MEVLTFIMVMCAVSSQLVEPALRTLRAFDQELINMNYDVWFWMWRIIMLFILTTMVFVLQINLVYTMRKSYQQEYQHSWKNLLLGTLSILLMFLWMSLTATMHLWDLQMNDYENYIRD